VLRKIQKDKMKKSLGHIAEPYFEATPYPLGSPAHDPKAAPDKNDQIPRETTLKPSGYKI
jgi:hypothetical protein